MQTEKNTIIVIKTILASLINLMTSRFEKQRRILASIVVGIMGLPPLNLVLKIKVHRAMQIFFVF